MAPTTRSLPIAVCERFRARQAALAVLAHEALSADDFAALLDDATRRVAQTMQVEDAWILECMADGNSFRVRAGTATRDSVRNSARAATIRGRTRPWGVLAVAARRRARSFTEDDIAFLNCAADIVALAIELHARGEAESALERLRAIQMITDTALSRLGLDDLLRELLARVRSTLQAEIASVRLVDAEQHVLSARAIDGIPFERIAHIPIPISAVELTRPQRHSDVRPPDGTRDWWTRLWEAFNLPLRSAMSVPLVVEGKTIGIVGVTSTRPSFSDEDLQLLQVVADRVAPAIERGRLMEIVRSGRKRLEVLSRRLLMVQEEERRRLAVELHDELGQVLTAVKINLESLARSQPIISPPHLLDTIASVDRAMESVRELALDLRPSVLDDLGLSAALRWLVNRVTQDTPIEAHLSIDAIAELEPELETACFRIAQEALTNIARHARARHLWLDLHPLNDGLELCLRDDGVGFDATNALKLANAGRSMGLLGMRERASLMGGELVVKSAPRQGTEVHVSFPVADRSGQPE